MTNQRSRALGVRTRPWKSAKSGIGTFARVDDRTHSVEPSTGGGGDELVGVLRERGSGTALAALRRATAADHQSLDALVDPRRLVEIDYYAAVVRGLIESAETVELALPLIPPSMSGRGLSYGEVSKRAAIDAESTFLDNLVEPQPIRHPDPADVRLLMPAQALSETMLGLLYVYVGSALGGSILLRVARTAPWWHHQREHTFLQPYGHHLKDRWRAVLGALESLEIDETNAAAETARAGFELHRRSLVRGLSVGGY
ncbi:heme oxygenase-like domain-containing protein [Mycobacterium antarcticum]|uniref:hypothetical protein n=1 Tax=unclassified Mycolicibacterium TaxID=2636767 RepID=UPI0024E0E522|nr:MULTISPECIES: hypothetical protein [unclassified Mycolicibacterium]